MVERERERREREREEERALSARQRDRKNTRNFLRVTSRSRRTQQLTEEDRSFTEIQSLYGNDTPKMMGGGQGGQGWAREARLV